MQKQGVCQLCNQPFIAPKTGVRRYCDQCGKEQLLATQSMRQKRWRAAHPEQKRTRGMEWYYRKGSMPEQKARYAITAKRWRHKMKLLVFAHYGQHCVCCGEERMEFLSVDHTNGDGAKHRKEIRRSNMCNWIIKHDYPSNFRILCFNCNQAQGIFGYCPHELDRAASAKASPQAG